MKILTALDRPEVKWSQLFTSLCRTEEKKGIHSLDKEYLLPDNIYPIFFVVLMTRLF